MDKNSKGLFLDLKESFFGNGINSSIKATVTIATMGVLIALCYVFERVLFIPVGDTSRYSFTFVIMAISGLILGGYKAMLVVVLADIIGSLILYGNVNPLITICVGLGGLMYGLLLYKKATILKIVIAACFNELVCGLILKTGALAIWYYGGMKAYTTVFATRAVQAAIMTPVEIVVLVILSYTLFPVLKRSFGNVFMN